MTKTIAKTYSAAREYKAHLATVLFVGCLIMAAIYALNTYSIISKTVAAQKIEAQTAALQSSVQNLDAQYITLSNKITPDIAKDYGLRQSAVSAYIPRTRSLGSAHIVKSEL